MRCFVVAGFLLTSASRGPSAIAEPLVSHESTLRADDLYLIFQFVKGRCHGNQIMLQKRYQRRLIPLVFIALMLENELV